MLKRHMLLASLFIIATALFLSGCAAEYEVNLKLASDEGGTLSGEGLYEEGEEVTVRAEAKEGYEFIAWFEAGEKVSEQEEYNFNIEENRELAAKFEIEEKEEEVKEEAEDTAGEVLFKAQYAGRRLDVSPDGKYLLTKSHPHYPIYEWAAFIEETGAGEALNGKPPEDFDSAALLPTPGVEQQPHIHYPAFTPDGDKLLYVGHEYMDEAAIYFAYAGLPPEVFHRLEINSDVEGGVRIVPAWKANQEGVYYVTKKGLFSYTMEDEEANMLYSSSELEGFPGVSNYTFNINSDIAELAWFIDGRLIILDLENEQYEPEVIETDIASEAAKVSYIFDGKYIALALVEDSLTLVNRESGELTEIDYKYEMTDYLNTYAWNEHGELVVLQEEKDSDFGQKLSLYNENLEKIDQISTGKMPRNSSEIVWLGDCWGVLVRNKNSFKIHAITF